MREASPARPGVKPASAFVALVLLATALSLALGYALKDNCTDQPWDGRQWTTLCANDIVFLYSIDDLQHDATFPPPHIEYPALIVLLIGLTGRLAHSAERFLQLNGVVAAASAMVAAAILTRLAPGRRALLFAIGPPLALYAFQNWDLIAVAVTLGACYLAVVHDRPRLAGLCLGLGAAVKIFPGLLLPAFVLFEQGELRSLRPTARTKTLLAGFAIGLLVPNAIVWVLSHSAWGYFWSFQAHRFPNPETSWFMIFRHLHGSAVVEGWWTRGYVRVANVLSLVLFLVVGGIVTVREWRSGRPRLFELSLAIVAIFLLTAKVFSPQYMLWLLPFLAIVRIPWKVVAACLVTDVAVLLAINWYYAELARAGDWQTMLTFLEIAVWARYTALAWVAWVALRSERAAGAEPALNEPAVERA
ncbi:MAG: glycosyltransferase 87 family protein [Actinomycetota bacterium]